VSRITRISAISDRLPWLLVTSDDATNRDALGQAGLFSLARVQRVWFTTTLCNLST